MALQGVQNGIRANVEDLTSIYKLDHAKYSLASTAALIGLNAVVSLLFRCRSDSMGPGAILFLNNALLYALVGYLELRVQSEGPMFFYLALGLSALLAATSAAATLALFAMQGLLERLWKANEWVDDAAGLQFVLAHKIAFGLLLLVTTLVAAAKSYLILALREPEELYLKDRDVYHLSHTALEVHKRGQV